MLNLNRVRCGFVCCLVAAAVLVACKDAPKPTKLAHPTDPRGTAPHMIRTDMFDENGDAVELNLIPGVRHAPSRLSLVVKANSKTLGTCFDLARRKGIDLAAISLDVSESNRANVEKLRFQETRFNDIRPITDKTVAACIKERMLQWAYEGVGTGKHSLIYLLGGNGRRDPSKTTP